MKNSILHILFFCLCTSVYAQKKQEVLDFINHLPTIEYGVLPFWTGTTLDEDQDLVKSFAHAFPYSYKDTINSINNHLMSLALCDSSYVIVKGKKVTIEMKNVAFEKKYDFGKWSYKGSKHEYYPGLYASAKSIFNNRYYVVYFWTSSTTQGVYCYSVVFDFYGNLLSYQHLDFWILDFPYYPFDNPKNYVRWTDYPHTVVRYLPNNLILAKDIAVTEGGGIYELSVLKDNGHYEVLKSWKEIGNLEKVPTGEYMNYISDISFDSECKNNCKVDVKIPFVVHDRDGYCNIREKADGKSPILRTINDGDMVWGRYLANGWVKIDFTVDKKGVMREGGYIHSSRLENLYNEDTEHIKAISLEEWKKQLKE